MDGLASDETSEFGSVLGVDGLVVGNVEGVVFGGGTCVQGIGIVGQLVFGRYIYNL